MANIQSGCSLQYRIKRRRNEQMKYLSFLILLFISLSSLNGRDTEYMITLILFRDSALRPHALSKEEFWSYSSSHDRIEIKKSSLATLIYERLSMLEKAKESDIDHHSAFILKNHKGAIDTFYTDPFFYQWEKQEKIYTDTSGFFEKTFRPLIIAK